MPRFVILRHETPSDSASPSHWDVMFECLTALRTWACDSLPDSNVSVDARQLADHRPAYLDYEGPVSGGRGTVTRWDEGQFQVLCDLPNRWAVRLQGKQLSGHLTLSHEDEGQEYWSTHFLPD